MTPDSSVPRRAPGTVSAPAAVLWDMDGTLVDTEPYWIEAEYEMAAEHGGTWSREHALNLVGNDLMTSAHYIREHMGIDLAPEKVVNVLLDGVVARVRHSIPWRPGARALLEELNERGVPCALVTMSYRRLAEPVVEQLTGAGFSALVTGDEVTRGKPHPEPYLRAAELLGVEASACLAIEDSDTGATSAARAGTVVLCVPHHVPVPPGESRVFAASLTDVDVDTLSRLHQAVRRGERPLLG